MLEYRATSIVMGNMKGGVGKSTVACLLASFFAKHKDKKVLVIDCDLKNPVFLKRQKKLKQLKEKKHNCFDVLSLDPTQLFNLIQLEQLEVLLEQDGYKIVQLASQLNTELQTEAGLGQIEQQQLYHYQGGYLLDNYDLVFFDLPGSFKEGMHLRRSYVLADLIITPIGPTIMDLNNTKIFSKFIEHVKEIRAESSYPLEAIVFINKANQTKECELLPQVLKQILPGWVNILENGLYNRVAYGNCWDTIDYTLLSSDLETETQKEKKEFTLLANKIFSIITEFEQKEKKVLVN